MTMSKSTTIEAAPVQEPLYGPGEITEERFDSMPNGYKDCVRSAIRRQALGEIGAGAIFARLMVRFYEDGDSDRAIFAAHLAEEEAGHCQLITAILPGIGLSKDIYETSQPRYGEIFGGTSEDLDSWEALIMFNWLAEKAGTMFLRSFRNTSYKPWYDTMKSIVEEEEGHEDSGITNVRRYLKMWPENRPLIQTLVDKWFPISLKLLGIPGSEKQQKYHKYGLKAEDSTEQIPVWLNAVLPDMAKLKLRVPSVDELLSHGVILPDDSAELVSNAQGAAGAG